MKLTGKKDMLIIGGALLLCAVAYLLFGAIKGGDRVKTNCIKKYRLEKTKQS